MSLLTDERLLWFVNRGSGVVVLVALTITTALGVMSTVRVSSRWWPRFVTQTLHRNLALLSVALLTVHVGTAVVDGYVDIGVVDVFVPFGSPYETLWTALGTIALDLIVLAALTSLARHRFGLRGWRTLHLSTYLAWPLALAHGLGMGTDQTQTWSVVLTALCVGTVAGAISVRLSGLADERRYNPPAPVLTE